MPSTHDLPRSFSHVLLSALPSGLRCKGVSAGPTDREAGLGRWGGQRRQATGRNARKARRVPCGASARTPTQAVPQGAGPPIPCLGAPVLFSDCTEALLSGPPACGADTAVAGWRVVVLRSQAWSVMLLISPWGDVQGGFILTEPHLNRKACVRMLGEGLPSAPWISFEPVIGWMRACRRQRVPGTWPTCPRQTRGPSWRVGIIECDTSCTWGDTEPCRVQVGGCLCYNQDQFLKPPIPKSPHNS